MPCAARSTCSAAWPSATQALPPDKRLDFRIGINVGDIIIDGDDIFGDGVNVAARLEALADPGGICVSRERARSGAGQAELCVRGPRRAGGQEHRPTRRRIPRFAGCGSPGTGGSEAGAAPDPIDQTRLAACARAGGRCRSARRRVRRLDCVPRFPATCRRGAVFGPGSQDDLCGASLPGTCGRHGRRPGRGRDDRGRFRGAGSQGSVGPGGAAPQRRGSLDAPYRHQGSGRGTQRALPDSGQRDPRLPRATTSRC